MATEQKQGTDASSGNTKKVQLAANLTVFGQPIALSNMDDIKKEINNAPNDLPQKMGFDATKGGDQKPIVVYSSSGDKGSSSVLGQISTAFNLSAFKTIFANGLSKAGVDEIDLDKIIVNTTDKSVDVRVGISFDFSNSDFLKFLSNAAFKDIIQLNAISFETKLGGA